MKVYKEIKNYIENNNLDLEKIIKDYSPYTLYIYDKTDFFEGDTEVISKIEKNLEKMNEVDKKIFLNFYYSSRSIKDIAKEEKMSEFSVKQRLYRIRKKIRKEVNRYE